MKPIAVVLCVVVTGVIGSTAHAQSAPVFRSPASLPPTRGYSHIVEVPAGTRLVYLAGQVPLDSAGHIVGSADFRAQATQVFRNLERALAASGSTFRDVVKLNYYVTDVDNLAVLREVRDQFINVAAPPASTLVEVRRLFMDGIMLEVEAIAVAPVR